MSLSTGSRLLDEALSPQRIFLTTEESKDALLHFLIRQMGEFGEVDDIRALESAIFTRESLMSTGIGLGVGVPHARISSVRRLLMAVGINRSPLEDYESIDNQPVQIVFLVAGRPDQQSHYVRLLAELSQVIKPEENRAALLAAESPEQVYDAIRKAL